MGGAAVRSDIVRRCDRAQTPQSRYDRQIHDGRPHRLPYTQQYKKSKSLQGEQDSREGCAYALIHLRQGHQTQDQSLTFLRNPRLRSPLRSSLLRKLLLRNPRLRSPLRSSLLRKRLLRKHLLRKSHGRAACQTPQTKIERAHMSYIELRV